MKQLLQTLPASRRFRTRLLLLFVFGAMQVQAAIVEPSDGYKENFTTQPSAANWSTRTFGSTNGSGEITTAGALDAAIQTNAASRITNQVVSATGAPPAAAAAAVWSSAGGYLQTRPTQTAVTLLMATLINNTGTNATSVNISYDYTTNRAALVAEEVRGHRVFYSLSGATNSWVLIEQFTQTSQGSLSADLTLAGTWANGSKLYLLWADDNGSGSPDNANDLDNFFITVLNGVPPPSSCVLNSPTNNQIFVTPVNVSFVATATPANTNEERAITGVGFFDVKNDFLGNDLSPPYTISIPLGVGSYQIYAVSTNRLEEIVFSATNAVTIVNPLALTLTAPTNGRKFGQATSVNATGTVTGGTAPFTVRFYTNTVLAGLADGNTGATYRKNLGSFSVGTHTVRASVTDSNGWVSNSVINSFTITGLLFASLSPASTSFNYGQAVTLTGMVVGGTAPYTATFRTNGAVAGSSGPGASPFVASLGFLPVGSYASFFAATDSVGATTNSATNVITILPNPLTTTLTRPTNGQNFFSSQGFGAAATAAVNAPLAISGVEFFLDGVSLGLDDTAPFSNFVTSASVGAHALYAVGVDSLGRNSFSATNQINIVSSGILVGPGGYTTSFDSRPAAGEWASLSSAGSSSAAYDLTNAVQALAASNITSQVVDGGVADPPVANALAFWTAGGGGYLGTRPSGNRFTALMATLINKTGTNATSASIIYDLAIKAPNPEADYPGPRVFYSLSGLSNTWVAIPELSSSSPAAGTLTANLSFATPWNQGTNLYLLWVDDNAVVGPDPAYTLDYFYASVTAGAAVPTAVTVTLTAPTNNAVFFGATNLALAATATSSNGAVARVDFFADGLKLGQDTNSPFSLVWTNPPPGPHVLTAVATDVLGASASSSAVNIFVYDAAGSPFVSLTSPPDDTVIEGPIDLQVTAFASAPGAVTNVQFFANGLVIGAVTNQPYSVTWSSSFGTNTLLAVAQAADGQRGTSAVVRVVITVPPTNVVAPTIDAQLPVEGATITSLSSIIVTFSERVQNVNATDLRVNNVPATTMTDSGSNYTFTFPQPPVGPVNITWSGGHGITDFGFPSVLPFDASGPGATWSYNLIDVQNLALTRGPYLQSGSPTGAVVRWRTDVLSTAAVRYGTNPASLTGLAVESVSTNNHLVQITGLQPATKYFYSAGTPSQALVSGTNFWFKTSPLTGVPTPTRFWVLGDSGTANSQARAVRDAYYNFAVTNNHAADFWLMLGDNAYNEGTDSQYQSGVFDMYPTTLRNLFLWPVLGNHETAQSTSTNITFAYLDIFSPPQNGEVGGLASGTRKYYSFDYANIHFIALDSMTSGRNTNSPMALWLQDDLADTTQEWIIVYFHHPPYTKGTHNSDGESDLVQIRQNILPILEAGGVDLVLNGHSHVHERSYLLNGHYGLSGTLNAAMKIDGGDGREAGDGAYQKNEFNLGTVYVVAGSSGQIGGGSLNHPAHFLSLNEIGSLVIDVNSNRLDAQFLTGSGTISDHFTLRKRAVVPPGLLRIAALPAMPGDQVTLTFDASAGQNYTLLFAPTLVGPWTTATNFSTASTNRVIQLLVPHAGASGFYRLRSP